MNDSSATSLSAGTTPGIAVSSAMLRAGQTFGSYRIVRLLGQGGMGEVYEAEDLESGRRVALKTLRQSLARPEDRQRFLREGRLAASINHPNSVYIFGSETIDGTSVITMELLAGGSLKERVEEKGPMPPSQAVDAILQAISGLEAAEAVGVLHRDIKPSNLFVDGDGTVKIGDFGLSVSTISMETQLTMTGTIMGTPMFAPPEQLRGDDFDVRSDIYSVGAALYYLLTGKPPFDARDAVKVIAAVIQEIPSSPKAIVRAIPSDLAAVVLRCLEKQPGARFGSYAALREALVPFSSAAPVSATLAVRFMAGCIDVLLVTVMLVAFGMPSDLTDHPYWKIARFSAFLIYYGFLEAFFGASLGKAFCGMRVVGPGGGKPGWRSLSRAVLYCAVLSIPIARSNAVLAVLSTVSRPIGLLLLFFTARRENGFSALHDRFSRTRVVLKRRVEAVALLRRNPNADVDVAAGPKIGPYTVIDTLIKTPNEEVLLAYDPKLQRSVWVRRLQSGTPVISDNRREPKRTTRLRWLHGKHTSEESWDAYGFIEGKPLTQLVEQRQSWSDVRRWLLDLAEEIRQGNADGTAIEMISPDRIWIGRDGHARLLEFALVPIDMSAANPFNLRNLQSAQDCLYRAAVAALTGRSSVFTESSVKMPALPLPLNARRFLSALRERSIESFEELSNVLRRLNEWDITISRSKRAGNILCVAAPISLLATGVMIGMVRKGMDLMRCFFTTLEMSMVAIAVVGCLALLVALIFRGRGLLTLFGATLVAADGAEITRVRSAFRTFVAFSPAFLAASVVFANGGVAVNFAYTTPLGLALMVIGAIVAVVYPERGLQDRIAGTVVVPRSI
jgi:hypothetical protein